MENTIVFKYKTKRVLLIISILIAQTFNSFSQKESIKTDAPDANDVTICEGSAATLSATGTDLKWYANNDYTGFLTTGESYTTQNLAQGTYYYYVSQTIDGVESSLTEVTVIVDSPPHIDHISGLFTPCLNSTNEVYTCDLTGGDYIYFWEITNGTLTNDYDADHAIVNWDINSGDATISIKVNEIGIYCYNTLEYNITIRSEQSPDISEIIQKSDIMLVSVDSGYAYQWYLNEEQILNATKQYYYNENMPAGEYQVRITDNNDCYQFSNIKGIEPTYNKSSLAETIKIYPNPASNNITIEIDNEFLCDIKYSISDNLGRKRDEDIISKEQETIVLDKNLSELPPGSYLIEFIFENKKKVSKQLIIK